MALLKALFLRGRTIFREKKHKIFDWETAALVHCYRFRGVAFGEPEVQVLPWCCYKV
jgi:hypothetical protein